jgi:hypothetical protein
VVPASLLPSQGCRIWGKGGNCLPQFEKWWGGGLKCPFFCLTVWWKVWSYWRGNHRSAAVNQRRAGNNNLNIFLRQLPPLPQILHPWDGSSEAGTTNSYAAPEFTTGVFSGVRIAQSSVFCALSTTNYFILYLYIHIMYCYGSNILTLEKQINYQ